MTDLELAECRAWVCIAESCFDHDDAHYQAALASLARLLEIPEPRP